jgi:hypothetical protein
VLANVSVDNGTRAVMTAIDIPTIGYWEITGPVRRTSPAFQSRSDASSNATKSDVEPMPAALIKTVDIQRVTV